MLASLQANTWAEFRAKFPTLSDRPSSYSQVSALAKRHKLDTKKDFASAQELLTKQVGSYDDADLCKLLLEISLLDSAYQRGTASRDDVHGRRKTLPS